MKLWEVFCFELGCQSRRVWTWLSFAALLGITYLLATEAFLSSARRGGYFLNAPFIIASVTVFGSLFGLLAATAVAGEAAARDVQTRMHPLVYTTPVGQAVYLSGRFLGAFVLNALILLAVPAGLLLAQIFSPDAQLIGPFHPGAYVSSYVLLALPNAFVATALLFAAAALSRRVMMSYLGCLLLFGTTVLCWQFMADHLQ